MDNSNEEDIRNRAAQTRQPARSKNAVLRELNKSVADEDVNGIRARLDYIKDNYPELEDTKEVKDARQLLEKLEDLRKKVTSEKLRQSIIQQNEKKIRQSLTYIEENGLEIDETEINEAKQLLERLHNDRANKKAMEKLVQATYLRDEKMIREAVQNVKDKHSELCDTRTFKDAENLLKRLDSDRVKLNQKMALERLRQAKLRQDEEKLTKELQEIELNFPQLKRRKEVIDAEDWLKILRTAKRLKECCRARNKNAIKSALLDIENENLQEPLKFLIMEARYILEELNRAKRSSSMRIDQASLNEIRRYTTPPPGVLPVMQAVFLLLGKDEGETKTWQQIQKLWKPTGPWNATGPKRTDGRKTEQPSLYSEIVNFNVENVDPTIAARAREIILGEHELVVVQPKVNRDSNDADYGEVDAGYRTDRTAKKTDELRAGTSTERETGRKYAETDDYDDDGSEKNPGDMDGMQEDVPEKITTVRTKKRGVDLRKLRKSCPVANALLVWVLEVAQQVEDRDGPEAMVPLRDVKQQMRIFGTFLPTITPVMNRGYYRDLAQNSVRRGQQPQKPLPPMRKPYGRNDDGKPFRYYQQVNHELPRLVDPLPQLQYPYESYPWPTSTHGNASDVRRKQQQPHGSYNYARPRYDPYYASYNDDDEQDY